MKQYLLFPNNDGDLKDTIFQSPYGILRDLLRERDIELHTYDQGDLRTADKVLCFNHRPQQYAACVRAGLRPEQLVLFLMEPKPVIATQYTKAVWDEYGTVFTYLDNLVDNRHIFKMFYPQGQELISTLPTYPERKFLTLMNANKYSYAPNELYSLRRRAISYFSGTPDFDLYGFGWASNGALNLGAAIQALRFGQPFRFLADVVNGFHHSPNYRGSVNDKRATVAQYRFAIAFENESKTQGYITEKIFDCLFAGTVPVYLGPDNITQYIPAECFIDQRQFSTMADLDAHLRSMTEQEWQSYHDAGQRYLRSPQFTPWSPNEVFRSIAAHL